MRNNQISSDLPAKITSIVFWGVVLVGLLIAVLMLEGREQELSARNVVETRLMAGEVENMLTDVVSPSPLTLMKPSLIDLIESMRTQLHFEALELTSEGDMLLVGNKHPGQEVTTRSLLLRPALDRSEVEPIEMTLYFSGLSQQDIDYRKRVLLSIGLTVVAFGIVLRKILRHLLTKPFASMIETAKAFGKGNLYSRFDDTRSDEFGFLAKFINRALESLVQQQSQLQAALTRVTQSEAALMREKARAEVTLQSIADAVITTNLDSEVQYMNPAAERLTGWSQPDAAGQPLAQVIRIVHDITYEPVRDPIRACFENTAVGILPEHAALIRRDGEMFAIEASAAPMLSDRGDVTGVVMVLQDVSHARKMAHQLSYQASHDPLTGLVNRREFDRRLEAALQSAAREGKQHVLMYIDLDQFKVVNDTSGHTAGDQLLSQLSTLLQAKIRDSDTLARLGGDEFGVLLDSCSVAKGEAIAESLRQLVTDFRFAWDEKIFHVGASIGLVAIDAESGSSAGLMSAADAACYMAKDEGRNRIQVFQGADNSGRKFGEMQWISRIQAAMADRRLHLYYQTMHPLTQCDGTEHAEILLRLEDEQGLMVSPMAFIPTAERYNMMPAIDRWVITNTLEWLADHPLSRQNRAHTFAINLSGQSLGDKQFLQYVLDEFGRTRVTPSQICFEITETAAIANIGRAQSFISMLKAIGCSFALDDFGSGMSSYSYLKNLDVNFLKIDGAFVKDLAHDPVDYAMVESINRIGHVMGLQTIAEFVEDDLVLEKLREIGVDYAQGYSIHRPEPLFLLV